MTETSATTPRTIQADGHLHGVIVGCRRADSCWLLIRRSATVASPLKLCFPGGGVDGDELEHQTARREMLEELGVEITPLRRVWQQSWPEKKLTLFGWYAELLSDNLQPDPAEVAEVLWLTEPQILAHRDALPGCAEFLSALVAQLPPSKHDR